MTLRRKFIFLFTLTLTCLSQTVSAEVAIFTSPKQQVNLIELYTSEGCSSCPPAEAWLNSLKIKTGLWTEFIPLAFHVAYWDYLGWKDHMGSVKNAERQRAYAASWGSRSVYTPGVVKNGREWRNWKQTSDFSASLKKAGVLELQWNEGHVDVRYHAEHDQKHIVVNIALLGFNIETDVKRGENRGRVLKHEFVVLAHKSKAMKNEAAQSFVASLTMEKEKFSDINEFALVGWVTEAEDLTPLQATGGFFI